MMQDTNSTSGKSVVIIKSIISNFESSRTAESFIIEIWQSIKKFADDNNTLMDILYQARGLLFNLLFNYLIIYINISLKKYIHLGSKRKRREPNNLNDFIVTTTTSSIYEPGPVESTESVKDYYRTNIYYKI